MSRYIDATDIAKQIADFKRLVNSPNSDYMTGYLCALSVTEGMIANTPTADVVEVRHGVWIEQRRDYGEYMVTEGFKCSLCGLEKMDNDYNYCPDCGARMDGEGREECKD